MNEHYTPTPAAAKDSDYSLLSQDNFGNKPKLALQLAQHLDNMTNPDGLYISNFGLDAPVAKQPVQALQFYLAAHGHPELKLDGLMGEKTRKATQEFLKANTGYDGPVDGSPLNSLALDSLSVALDNDKQMFADHLLLPPGMHGPSADEIKEFALKHPNAAKEFALKHPKQMKAEALDQRNITPHALADALSKDDLERHMPRSSLRTEQSHHVAHPPVVSKATENHDAKSPVNASISSPSTVSPLFMPPF